MTPAAVFGWLRLVGEAIGLVRSGVDVVQAARGEPCPDTLRSAEDAAKRGQAAGAAANASQAATSAMMHGSRLDTGDQRAALPASQADRVLSPRR